MDRSPLFAEVILPLALQGTYTYAIPEAEEEKAKPGMRVMVQLGKRKLYSGIISEVHDRVPENFTPKPILSFPDDKCLVGEVQLQFWSWISKYYMCTPGEVMHAALPGGLKLSGETVLKVAGPEIESSGLDQQEQLFLDYFSGETTVSLDEIRRSRFGNDGLRLTRELLEKGVLETVQHVRQAYQPQKVRYIVLSSELENEEAFGKLLDSLERAPAQVKALESFVQIAGLFDKAAEPGQVERRILQEAGVAHHAIAALVRKGIFSVCERTVSRIHDRHDGDIKESAVSLSQLTRFQDEALNAVREKFRTHPAVLLHGITSSGKTEIYIHLIGEQIDKGKQVLYLLPEIALTTQIIHRLRRVFGKRVGIYHSRYSDHERVEVYRNLAGLTEEKPYDVILGVRSAIFLPFDRLGLVIVDEEHENTYKQFNPAPRYHARDAATILGLFTGANVLLGSATPSFETLHNGMTGKYGIVEVNRRYGDVELPEVVIADVARARKRKQLKSHFTPELTGAIEETLDAGEQAILFQNRRGHSNYLQCSDCQSILKCSQCDVSLTYHQYSREMVCHYCGFRAAVPAVCPDCRSSNLIMRGFGTEKIEDEIVQLFPRAKVGRLDLDRTRTRKAFENLIADFEAGRTQVLVGTQMVTKGLDFGNVSLVGIVDADSMLNFPDFRAFERSYQLMVQVSGRAGRRKRRGKVIIQTMDPTHPVIERVTGNDFRGFFEQQMEERKIFKYPPYVRMIRITLRHEIPSILDGGSVFLANELRELLGSRVLGPQQPFVGKTHGKYIRQIILKIEKEISAEKVKQKLAALLDIFSQNPVYRQIRVTVDVDPQ